MAPIDFLKMILEAMDQKGLNPNRLARLVEGRVSRSLIYDYLAGRHRLSDDKLAVILEALEINLSADSMNLSKKNKSAKKASSNP